MDFLRVHQEITPIAPEVLWQIYGWPVTNSFMSTVLVAFLIAGVGVFAVPSFKAIPGLFQSILEIAYEAMTSLIAQITTNITMARDVVPLVTALFVFIGLSNALGIVPGLSSITWEGTSIFRTPTSDFNTTVALALGVIFLIQVDSIRLWGPLGYLGRFVKVKELYVGARGGIKTFSTALIEFFIGFLDIFSELAKVISLSFRLFGNMFAGEVLMVLILGAFAFGVPALWLAMSSLFAIVQAIVFGALATVYYTLAMKEASAEASH